MSPHLHRDELFLLGLLVRPLLTKAEEDLEGGWGGGLALLEQDEACGAGRHAEGQDEASCQRVPPPSQLVSPYPSWSPCAGWCPPMPPYLPIPAWSLHNIRSPRTSWCPPIPAWFLRPTPCPQRAQGGNPVLLSPLRNPSRLKSLVFFSLSMGLGPPRWVAQGPVQKTLHWQRRMA